MYIGLMKKGDTVLNVTKEFVAIRRKSGEVDVIPLISEGLGYRVDENNIITIGYGDNTVTIEHDNGVSVTYF